MGGGGSVANSPTRAEALTVQASTYGAVIPWLRGAHRIPPNLLWYGDFKATAHQQEQGGKGGGGATSTNYTYSASLILGLCHGIASSVGKVWKDKSTTTLPALGMTLFGGLVGQPSWTALAGKGVEAIGYSGIAYVAARNYDLGDSTSFANHSFEVVHSSAYTTLPTTPDIDPAVFTRDLLTDKLRGASLSPAVLGDWTEWSNYCVANGLLMSPLLDTQSTAADALSAVASLTNTGIVWSGGVLKMRPYGDQAITANGRTFTPDLTPVYQLDDTCYCPAEGDAPVTRALTTPADLYNSVSVEFHDRANAYNNGIVTAKDLTDISVNGVRQMDTIEAHWICEAPVARLVAELRKQRALGVAGTYTFPLPWHYALVECMDLLTLRDSVLMLDDVPVRVIQIDEQSDEDMIITAEDYPAGVASAPLYPVQVPAGFADDAYAPAPSVTDAVFFEAPGALAAGSSGLEVWGAVASPGGNWGGCTVWVSLDGTHYTVLKRVEGGSRLGRLAAPIAGGNLQLSAVTGALASVSATDANLLTTLSIIVGAVPEYLAYQTATLTGAGAYTLSGLVRGAYGSTSAAHAAGDRFVRCDDAIVKSGGLDASYVGKVIYFKLTSFNVYGGAEESLSDVDPFTYTVLGYSVAHRLTTTTLSVKANYASFTTPNYNEAYLHGRDASGAAADVDGTIMVNGAMMTVPRGPLYTNLGPAAGYIVWESSGTGISTLAGTVNFVMARRNAGTWEYDNNGTSWVPFFGVTPTMYIIGTIETGAADSGGSPGSPPGITAVSVWGAASTLAAEVAAADQAYAAAAAAQSTATTAAGNATAALSRLTVIDSNGYYDRGEKPALIKEWASIADEKPKILAQAAAYGITTEGDAYLGKYNSLNAYLTGLSPAWNDTTTDTPIVAATDKVMWGDYYAARTTLLTKIAAVAGLLASWTGVTGRPKSYLARSYGLSATPPGGLGFVAGLFNAETSAALSGYARSYTVTRLNAAGNVVSAVAYDIWGGGGAPAAMAAALNAMPDGDIVVVVTYDEPRNNRLSGGLPDAMYRCGASPAVFGSPNFRSRGAYILVAIVGCGQGKGAEIYAGDVDADTRSWTQLSFSIQNGVLTVSGLTSGANSLADYGYTGALNATANAIIYQSTDPAPQPDGTIWVNGLLSYVRVGGAWVADIGAGGINTSLVGSTAIGELAAFTGTLSYSTIG